VKREQTFKSWENEKQHLQKKGDSDGDQERKEKIRRKLEFRKFCHDSTFHPDNLVDFADNFEPQFLEKLRNFRHG